MMSDPNTFTVTELKEKLKIRGLPTTGAKAELITRLMEADPTSGWTTEGRDDGDDSSREDSVRRESALRRREIEFYKREKELAERELELARREISLLRGEQRADPANRERRQETMVIDDVSGGVREMPRTHSRVNITAIAELVSDFDGSSDNFDVWEKQIRLLRTTYSLEDDLAKILIGMKLKRRALEWFHSKPEYIGMTCDALIDELKAMFRHRQSKVIMRRRFEGRVWKKDETFHEYLHEKVIMGNRVPIDADELLDYVIDGIPDSALREARMQRFNTTENLLEAFEKITLRDRDASRQERRSNGRVRSEGNEKSSGSDGKNERSGEKNSTSSIKRCFNCGTSGHVSASCPTKELGAKCFGCGERGHIASNCKYPKKSNESKNVRAIEQLSRRKYTKIVMIDDKEITALIDTGSDISLIRADEYIKLGSPRFQPTEIRFSGVGSSNIAALGEFRAKLTVDGHSYPILIRVISDTVLQQRFIIGTDFLDAVEVSVKQGAISISPFREQTISKINQPEIFQIDIDNAQEANEVDVFHIRDTEYKHAITSLVESYKPAKMHELDIKMTLVLRDDEPVYQKARRLAPVEREIVNAQIDEWEKQGIVRPSFSDYASPVVLVGKKDGSHRLCVDYRLLNKKIIRDRYPLPLIEDQLDLLQGTKIFSTLDLKNGFFHVRVDESSVKYTAFIVPDGQYEFLRVPFGLCNSPSVFQRYVNAVFRDLIRDRIALVYMDDLIVLSDDYDSGLRNLENVLKTASQAGLIINWHKCNFLQEKVEFLGHIITGGSVQPSERKIEAVEHFPEPKNLRQVQAFLGLTGYFRKFIRNYSTLARPLSNLLKAGVEFCFDAAERDAFKHLKSLLTEKPLLSLYRVGADTELHTDASMHGYGAILLQRNSEDRLFHPVYYASGKTTPAEEKYTSYELEVLAIVKALKRFRVYLIGIEFKIVTDCRAFTLTMNKRDLCVRVARWALLLEEFQYTIEHRPGKSMLHVDALSRNSLSSCLMIDECEEGLTARLRKAQMKDDDISKILDAAKQGPLDGYVMRGGLLYKEVDDEILLVVPKTMQSQIIRRAHERGHFATSKTEKLVRNDYWIPGLRSKVEKIVHNCIACILSERKTGKQEGLLNPIEKGSLPLDTFHVDHLGPLPSTKKRYIYILAVVDAFSKFVWLYATKTTTTAEVVDRLKRQSAVFSNPRRIISDRGSAFTSKEFRDYCKLEDIEHSLITTGIPRANGQVERLNRTLIPLLTKLSAPKPSEWHKYLDIVQQCLNTTLHRSIGMTPFRLLFGTHPRVRDNPDIKELLEKELVVSFQDNRDELRQRAKESILKIQQENKRGYNKNRKKASQYREGDIVAIKRTQYGPGLKFAQKYLGPYEVFKVLRNHRYIVRKIGEQEGPLQTSTAADFMKPWISDDDSDLFEDSAEDEINEHSGRMSGQDGRV